MGLSPQFKFIIGSLMHMMFSKYVDGGAVFEVGDVLSKVDYSEQATKTFALLSKYLTNAQLAHNPILRQC